MPDVIHAAIDAAESQGKYINNENLDEIKRYFQTGELRVRAASTISANQDHIIHETFNKSLLNTSYSPCGSLYTTRRYAACLRDLGYFLRYITYAMLAGDTGILDERVLNGLKETYNSLGIPIDVTIQAIQAMKEVTASLIEPEAAKEINVYFDYICAGLQTDTEMLAQSEAMHENTLLPTELLSNTATPESKIPESAPTYKEETVSDRAKVNSVETETTETAIQDNLFQPKTPLGRKLWEIRQKIVASGEPLLGWEELEQEVTERRNERDRNIE